jgi:dipeptidyl aminopeptidase/acylaminoacyl peptidase
MRPSHIGALISASDPRVAPGGERVTFTEQRIDLDDNRYVTGAFVTDLDGARVPLLEGDADAADVDTSMARWSPDGTRVAFVQRARTDEAAAVIRLRAADGKATTLCTPPESPSELEWSPDGSRIMFVARDPDRAYYAAPGETRKPKDTPARRITHFFTREDSEDFTFDRPSRVFVVDAVEGATPYALSDGPGASGASWSPDGSAIAYCEARHPDWDLDLANDIWIAPLEGDAPPRQLTKPGRSWSHTSWSPDGARIAANVEPTPGESPSHGRVVVLNVRSGVEETSTDELDRNCSPYPTPRAPLWNSHAQLLFMYEDAGSTPLVAVTVVAPGEGTCELTPLVEGNRCIVGFDQRDGTLAVVIGDAATLPELYVSTRAGDGELRRITDATARFCAATGADAVVPERFTARSSDGVEVECWAYRPEGDGPFPTLLNIHGGPFTQYGYKVFDEFQMQLAAGFAVVCCNPRGSSGYTEAWGRAVRWPECKTDPGTGWGGIDYDDVMACIDTAVASFGWIDGDRLGVLGGSYGGYLTSWIIGHTKRFRAACSERSVNNLLSEEHNSDVASAFRDYLGVTHLENPRPYVRSSPITYVREIDTPLLILHSEHDLRCPINQAEELFVALRLLGRTPEFWRFPGECHELSRSGAPKHRVQRAEIILDFFTRHLQPV